MQLNVASARALLVFASEPQAKYFGVDASSPTYLGYTEQDSLRLVVDALQSIRSQLDRPVHVIVKLHPLEENMAQLGALLDRAPDLPVHALRHYPPRNLITAADVVMGMTSIFLLEAALIGRPVLSVQPNRTHPDGYIMNQRGLIEQSGCLESCRHWLTQAFYDTEFARQQRRQLAKEQGFDGRASQRIANFIYGQLDLPQSQGA